MNNLVHYMYHPTPRSLITDVSVDVKKPLTTNIQLNAILRTALIHDRIIKLSSPEFTLLEILLKNRGSPLSLALLFKHMYGHSCQKICAYIIPFYIRHLRKKIASIQIQSIAGMCYMLMK